MVYVSFLTAMEGNLQNRYFARFLLNSRFPISKIKLVYCIVKYEVCIFAYIEY